MVTKKVSVWSIVLYVLAGLLFVYALWAAIAFYQYVHGLQTSGQLTTLQGQAYNITASLMSSSLQYVIYGVLFIAIGKLLAARQNLYVKRTVVETPVIGQEMEQEIGIAWAPAQDPAAADKPPAETAAPAENEPPSGDNPPETPVE